MTKEELNNLIPRETMVYAKRDGVGYTFMHITEDGDYQLCGLPYPYPKNIMLDCFEIRR